MFRGTMNCAMAFDGQFEKLLLDISSQNYRSLTLGIGNGGRDSFFETPEGGLF